MEKLDYREINRKGRAENYSTSQVIDKNILYIRQW
jgi:hypothetical protein